MFTLAVSSATKAGACAAQVEAEAQETSANRITQSHFLSLKDCTSLCTSDKMFESLMEA